MPYITMKDSTWIYFKQWGCPTGQPVVFCHGWPLSSDAWDNQMLFLASKGYRCIAHDRRGHGRSSQPWSGNDMNTYADDLLTLIEYIDLQHITLVGHSTGGGEVVRFLGRHGSKRVAKAVLIGSVTPLTLQTEDNTKGLHIDVFNAFRSALVEDRAQFFLDVPRGPFFGFNRPEAVVSEGLVQDWYRQGMQAGLKNVYDCVKAFSETDFTEDMKNITVPVLVLHGDDDQIVPIDCSAKQGIKLLKRGVLKVYPGGSHALPQLNKDQVNEDLWEFLKHIGNDGQKAQGVAECCDACGACDNCGSH